MPWFYELLRRLRTRLRGARFDEDLAEELRLHQALRAEELHANGASTEDAAYAARRRFGNETQIREESREAWGWTFLDRLWQDLRYGLRSLTGQPGFALTAVLSLALGIGANTAIFSILDAVLLRTLPVEDPQGLVQIKLAGGGDDELNTPLWEAIRDQQRSFSGTLAYGAERFTLGEPSEGRFAAGLWVSGDFFRVLGVPAMQGRAFTSRDDAWGGEPVVVISYRFWRSHFAEGESVIGKTVRLNRRTFTVIGVTPPWFTGLDLERSFDVAIPLGCQPLLRTGATQADEIYHWWLRILGRVPPGRTLKQSEDRFQSIAPEILKATTPADRSADDQAEYRKTRFELKPAGLGFSSTRTRYRTALFVLMGTVGLVLLIACANIANLLLARAAARRRELSVRIAIGASRARIVRQLMTESLLLALLGAGAGFLFSLWGSRALVRLLSTSARVMDLDVTPDWRLLAFTMLAGVATALLFGLIPALRGTRIQAQAGLKEHEGAAAPRLGLGRALVAGQVALSLVLLAGAGLFTASLRNLLTVDAGFDRHNVLLVGVDLPESVAVSRRQPLYDAMLARLSSLLGVESAAGSALQPIGEAGWAQVVEPEGVRLHTRRDGLLFLNRVTPGYFRTFGTPLLRGRDFDERDTATAQGAIILNETAVRRFYGAGHPLGRIIRMNGPGGNAVLQVVGVVKDTKYNRLDEKARPIGYLAAAQDAEPGRSLHLALRSGQPMGALMRAVRAELQGLNREAALEFSTMETRVNDSLVQPRLVALLSSVFGALALLLAVVGLYGVTAYSAQRRRGEIGIRIALGAPRGSVMRLMMRDVAVLLAAGMPAGLLLALAAGRVAGSLLYGLKADDARLLAAACAVLCASAVLAAYGPAHRAARIDPMAALREE